MPDKAIIKSLTATSLLKLLGVGISIPFAILAIVYGFGALFGAETVRSEGEYIIEFACRLEYLNDRFEYEPDVRWWLVNVRFRP